jgi:hypothetical protein
MSACCRRSTLAGRGLENGRVARRRRFSLVRDQPVERVWCGVLGCAGLLPVSTWVCIPRRGPSGRREVRRAEGARDGCVGGTGGRPRCRQAGGRGLCPHSRSGWPPGQRDPHLSDDEPVAGRDGGLAGRVGGEVGRDGVDRYLLEAGVLRAGGPDGHLAAERGAHEGRAGPEVGRQGRGVDRAAARARAGRAVVRALPADPPAAEPHQVSGAADGGSNPRCGAAGAAAGGRVDQAVRGGLQRDDFVGAGDAGAAGGREHRRGGDGGSGALRRCGASCPIWPRR